MAALGASVDGFVFGAVTVMEVSGLAFALWDGVSGTAVDGGETCEDSAVAGGVFWGLGRVDGLLFGETPEGALEEALGEMLGELFES
jgi:hypothetical protein